jgi:hypothetical protein
MTHDGLKLYRAEGWLLGLTAAVILLGGNARGQSLEAPPISEPVRTPKVRLELRTYKRVYSLRDEIVLDAQLYNRTQERVYVYNEIGSGFKRGLVLHIVNGAGKRVQSWPLVDPPPPPQEVHDWKVLTPIDPGTFYGVKVSARVSNFFSKPGVYKLQLTYMSMLRPDLLDDAFQRLPIILHDDPVVVSSPVTIEIRRREMLHRKTGE